MTQVLGDWRLRLPWSRARWQARLTDALAAYLDASAEETPAVFARYRAQLLHPEASARLRQRAADARARGATDDADGYDDLAARLEHLRALGAGHRTGSRRLPWPLVALLVRFEMGDLPEDPQQQVALLERGLRQTSPRRAPLAWAALQLELGRAWTLARVAVPPDEAPACLTRAIACFDAARPAFARAGLAADEVAALQHKGDALADLAGYQRGATRTTTMESAIQSLDDALAKQSATQTPHVWAAVQSDKGAALVELAGMAQGGARAGLLVRALACFDAARAVIQPDAAPSQWAALQLNTGNALQELADLGASAEKVTRLQDAITRYEVAVDLYERLGVAEDWALAQNNLGNALTKRAELDIGERRLAGLQRAITCYDAALQERRRDSAPLDWASTQSNRANALIDLAWSVPDAQRTSILREAIAGYDAALAERRRDRVPLDWALTQHNKGIALSDLAERLEGAERASALREAVACFDTALTERRHADAPADWAASTGAKGSALAKLATTSTGSTGAERVRLLRAASSCFEEALSESSQAVVPVEWAMLQNNLALTFIDLATEVSGAERTRALARAVACYEGALSVITRAAMPADHRRIAQRAGMALFQRGEWAAAVAFLAMALDALDDLFALSVTRQGRATELTAGGDLAAHLAYALLRADAPGAAMHAAVALERGRARATGEAIARQQAQLAAAAHVAPALLEAFHAASDRLVTIALHAVASEQRAIAVSGAENATLAEAHTARAAYDASVALIREQTPDFLRVTDAVVDAQTALAADERLVYVASTAAGAVGVLLGPSAPTESVVASAREAPTAGGWYDETLTTAHVEALLRGAPAPMADNAVGTPLVGLLPAQNGRGHLPLALEQVTQALGQPGAVLTRVASACVEGAVRRLVLVPCGLLGLLPLHAAELTTPGDVAGAVAGGAEGDTAPQYLLDLVRVAYAPSARIWHSARTRSTSDATPAALVVGNPLPQPPGLAPLPGAEVEARQVSRLLDGSGPMRLLETGAATRAATIESLQAGRAALTHLHFACHGVADLDTPERSGLVLAQGERLTVGALLDPATLLRFERLRLVVLSACQTGLPGARLPDEAVGLPASWLQAGAAGVIASQWPVSDAATLALMTRFYEIHLLDQVEPVEALWLAQRWLRGIPRWRADCVVAGAHLAARGMDARDAIDAMEMTLRHASEQAHVTDLPAQGADCASNGERTAGNDSQRVDAVRQIGPRHWAAIAIYGS